MRIKGFFELGAPYVAALIKCPDLDLAIPLRLLIVSIYHLPSIIEH